MTRTDLFISGQEGYHSYRIPALVVAAAPAGRAGHDGGSSAADAGGTGAPNGGSGVANAGGMGAPKDGSRVANATEVGALDAPGHSGSMVLAFCEGRRHTGSDDDEIDLLVRRSSDGGRTWEPQQVVVSDGDRTCGNPCPVVDEQTGTVWLLFCKDNQEVLVTRSDDDGLRWSDPVEITDSVKDPAWSYVGTGPGHGVQLASGRLLVPSWCDETPGPVRWRQQPGSGMGAVQSSYALFSDDHGESWQRGEMLTRDASDECEAVETTDGSVYMTMRSRQGRKCRGFAWSRDGGESWSEVEYDASLLEPSCQGGIVRLDQARVLMTHPSCPDRRERLVVQVSEDECRSWREDRVLEEGYAGYSDLAIAADGQVLCLYEGEGCGKLVLMGFGM